MYEELVKRLHQRIALTTAGSPLQDDLREAADAIEELSREVKSLKKILGTHPDPKGEPGEPGVPPSRWILVTERLPKYGDWVLGIGPKHGYHVCEYRGITHFPYSGDSPWFSAKGRTLNITHWMPLPEPPKEET